MKWFYSIKAVGMQYINQQKSRGISKSSQERM